jgi:hypothetical protein
VFVPVFASDPGDERFFFSPLGNTATKLSYWDQDAYVSELVVTEAPDETSLKQSEGYKSAADIAAAAAEKEGLVVPGAETEAKAKKRKIDAKEKDLAKSKKVSTYEFALWDYADGLRQLRHISNFGATAMPNFTV